MQQIQGILLKNDIAGSIVLHTPGFSEYLNHVSPTYSCATMEANGLLRIRAKAEDYNGDVKIRNEKLRDTSDMFHHLSKEAGTNVLSLMEISDKLDQLLGAEHFGSGHSSHTEQNN